jgi:uncharacterized membrane protein
LKFCNKTMRSIDVAIMYKTDVNWETVGWYSYAPGECAQPKPLSGSLLRSQTYYFYAKNEAYTWDGRDEEKKAHGCISLSGQKFRGDADLCAPGQTYEVFRTIDNGGRGDYIYSLMSPPDEELKPSEQEFIKNACDILHQKLNKPSLPSTTIELGRVPNPFLYPEIKAGECTNTYDTGVPDPSTCRSEYNDCDHMKDLGLLGKHCVPATRTKCSNIRACNTWSKPMKRFNECAIKLTLKLPNYVAEPMNSFIDNTYNTLERARQAGASLPYMCAPEDIRRNASRELADYITQEVTKRVRRKVESRLKEIGEQWLLETGVASTVASIPSGGIGGAAALGTQIATFIYRAHQAVKPILKVKEAVDFAEDLGFSAECGPGRWTVVY